MGQYWELINIDHRQQLINHGGLKLWEILHNRMPEMLVDLLKVPDLKRMRFADAVMGEVKGRAMTRNKACKLLALPQEILDRITSYVQEGLDVICLALSHSYFFRLLAERVRQAVIADEAPWAGARIVLVGDYATSVPSSVTAAETHAFVTTHDHEDDPDMPPSADQRAFRARNPLYSMQKGSVSDAVVPVDWPADWAEEWARIAAMDKPRGWKNMRYDQVVSGVRRARGRRLVEEEMERLDRLFAPSPSHSPSSVSASASSPSASSTTLPTNKNLATKDERPPPSSSSYVLRNLTKRLFVRDSALAHRSSRYRYSLGEALCTRVLWTADPSGTMGLACRGKWAGDRFDIVRGEEIGVVQGIDEGNEDEEEEHYPHNLFSYTRDEEEEEWRDETMAWKDVSAAALRRFRRVGMDFRMDGKRC